jgi:hypothetical protein
MSCSGVARTDRWCACRESRWHPSSAAVRVCLSRLSRPLVGQSLRPPCHPRPDNSPVDKLPPDRLSLQDARPAMPLVVRPGRNARTPNCTPWRYPTVPARQTASVGHALAPTTASIASPYIRHYTVSTSPLADLYFSSVSNRRRPLCSLLIVVGTSSLRSLIFLLGRSRSTPSPRRSSSGQLIELPTSGKRRRRLPCFGHRNPPLPAHLAASPSPCAGPRESPHHREALRVARPATLSLERRRAGVAPLPIFPHR